MSAPILLCVDDRTPLLQLLKANFEKCGYSVLTATNAVMAIARLQESPVAAVLLEYKPEGIDAEAVAFHIRNRFPHQRILLLSAYSDLPARVLWLVDEYVMRSEPLDNIVKILERLISSTAAHTSALHEQSEVVCPF